MLYLPEDDAVICIKSAICCRSDIGVFGLGLAGTIPVLHPIPLGLGGGIISYKTKIKNYKISNLTFFRVIG